MNKQILEPQYYLLKFKLEKYYALKIDNNSIFEIKVIRANLCTHHAYRFKRSPWLPEVASSKPEERINVYWTLFYNV